MHLLVKEYLISHHDVVREPLAYVIRKTIMVMTNGDYPMCATPDDEMIAWMLHLLPEKNRLLSEHDS